MPIYVYYCEANGRTVEVKHGIDFDLTTWGEVCYAGQVDMGDTEFLAPVRRVLSPPAIAIPASHTDLRSRGFTKLVKRDDGIYENVTRSGDEARYMRAGEADTLPHLHKKVGD